MPRTHGDFPAALKDIADFEMTLSRSQEKSGSKEKWHLDTQRGVLPGWGEALVNPHKLFLAEANLKGHLA